MYRFVRLTGEDDEVFQSDDKQQKPLGDDAQGGGAFWRYYTERTSSDFDLIETIFEILSAPSCFLRKHEQLWCKHKTRSFFTSYPPGCDL